jgi:hypothetical protein
VDIIGHFGHNKVPPGQFAQPTLFDLREFESFQGHLAPVMARPNFGFYGGAEHGKKSKSLLIRYTIRGLDDFTIGWINEESNEAFQVQRLWSGEPWTKIGSNFGGIAIGFTIDLVG